MKPALQGIPETMLIPLWARAYETKKKHPLLRDPDAVALVEAIDYDFSRFRRARLSQIGSAIRARILDEAARDFIREHPDAVCLNLACGLDTRFSRVKSEQTDWYNIDLPEGMALRNALLHESSPHIHNIAMSMFDPRWTDAIETNGRPVLILMEGASMYFKAEEMRSLFQLLIKHFAPATMLLEVMASLLVNHQKYHDSVKRESAPFQWGVTRGREVEELCAGVHLVWERSLYEGYRRHWGLLGLLSLIPWVNRNINNKILCLTLEKETHEKAAAAARRLP